MVYGYARVSTAEQHLERQIVRLIKENVPKENIFCDKNSGKDFEREQYLLLRDTLKSGDMLVINSIDRLGRNYDMIIHEWSFITRQVGADIKVLDMPLLDTSMHKESLTGKLISDIVLQLLSYVAQKERENLRVRQQEGILIAKQRGVVFGRPKAPEKDNAKEVYDKYLQGEIQAEDAAKKLEISISTFYRRVSVIKKQLAENE